VRMQAWRGICVSARERERVPLRKEGVRTEGNGNSNGAGEGESTAMKARAWAAMRVRAQETRGRMHRHGKW
jgi:hypothetical protein